MDTKNFNTKVRQNLVTRFQVLNFLWLNLINFYENEFHALKKKIECSRIWKKFRDSSIFISQKIGINSHFCFPRSSDFELHSKFKDVKSNHILCGFT